MAYLACKTNRVMHMLDLRKMKRLLFIFIFIVSLSYANLGTAYANTVPGLCASGIGSCECKCPQPGQEVVNSTCSDLTWPGCAGAAVCECTAGVQGGSPPAPALCGAESINTAIGCIPIGDPLELAKFLLSWGIGVGSGIAFLLIVYSGFMIISSGGDPEKLNAGKQLLTAAVFGLLFMIFGVFILRIIGVDLLGLPEFGL